MNKKFFLLSTLLAILLVIVSCSPTASETVAPAADDAPLAALDESPVIEAPEVEEVMEEAAPAVAELSDFDLVSYVDSSYMSVIPDGYFAMGDIEAFKTLMESSEIVLIDVREVSEYEAGHIEGAINIPLRTITDNLDMIPTDMPVMIYCASGYRAAMTTSALHMLGYDNVRSFPPGWKGWTAAEEPVSLDAVVGDTYAVPDIEPELMMAVDQFMNNIPEGFLALKTIDDLNALRDSGAFLLDVRQPTEFVEGRIPGAVNIPIRELAANVAELPTDTPIVVYCASGHRAALSTAALQVMGYDNVRAFPAGWKGWTAAEGEVESG